MKRTTQYLFCISFIIIYLLIALIGTFQPPMGDDLFNLANVRDLGIIKNTLFWYNNISGRILYMLYNSLIAYNELTLMLSGILSAVFFFFNVFFICYVILRRKPKIFGKDTILFLLVTFTLWFLPFGINEAVFWKSGMIYSLCSVVFLIFFIPYYLYFNNIEVSKYFKYLLFFLGIALGNGIEQGFISMSVFLFLLFLFKIKERGLLAIKEFPWSLWMGLIGLLIGFLINYFSPGSWNRYASVKHNTGIFDFITQILTSLLKIDPSSWFTVVLIFILQYFGSDKKPRYKLTVIFSILILFNFSIFILVPDSLTPRTFWFPSIFLIILIFNFYNVSKSNLVIIYPLYKILIPFMVIVLYITMINAFTNNIFVYNQFIERVAYVKEMDVKKEKKEIFPYLSRDQRITVVHDLSIINSQWQNTVFSKYCKTDTINCNPFYRSVYNQPLIGIKKIIHFAKK